MMKQSMENRRRKRWKRIILIIILVLFALYVILVNVLVSAALVPSFMRKLDAFEEITEESYSEQVQTTDIQNNRAVAVSETDRWLETVEISKWHQTSTDGYKLVAAIIPAAETAGTEDKEADNSADGTGIKNIAGKNAAGEASAGDQALKAETAAPQTTADEADGETEEAVSHKWAVVLHGYTGWKEEMYPFAYFYYQRGYNILAPDLRCQGESEGNFIGMGWTDREDVLGWIRMILKQDPEAEIVIHGQSMGAACALMVSGMEELPSNVKAVISDCAYTDAYSMFRQDIREWFNLPAFPLVDSANLALQLRGGYDLKKASALNAVKQSKVPTLFIHGDEDAMVPVSMAYELYDAAACEKQLLIVEGAGHGQSQDKAPVKYWHTVFSFIDSV